MKSITVTNETLFAVAAEYLSDATQWVRIAALNNIVDPWLSGLQTILVPEIDSSAGGGVGVQ